MNWTEKDQIRYIAQRKNYKWDDIKRSIIRSKTISLSVIHFFKPIISDDPTTVSVNIFVRSFSKIDDVKMVSENGNSEDDWGEGGCWIGGYFLETQSFDTVWNQHLTL